LFVDETTGLPQPTGNNVGKSPYVIGLFNGWNMIGDPFTYSVDLAGALVQYNGQTVTIAQAVKNGWLYGYSYRYVYDSDQDMTGHYEVLPIASATLYPWEAQWLRITSYGNAGWPSPDLNVILPANPSAN
jgi:hypothetical protein